MSWVQVVFGWPAIVVTLALFALAFTRERSTLGFWALLSVAPFMWYASRAPNGILYAVAMFGALATAAWLLHRGRRGWALLCVMPFAFWVAILAVYVASQ